MLCPTRVRQFLLVVSILITFTKTTVAQTAPCTSLIATNGNVKFSASTSSLGPGYPYLNSSHVWCAGVINDEQYLQVDFGFILFLDRLSVQGHGGSNRSVSQYYVETSNDNINYQEVVETPGGATKTFYGPMFDGDTVVSQNLSTPIQARYVRFSPQEPTPRNFNYLCMRVDVLSCQNVLAPINGNLSQWSAWSTCPADCSRRITSRTRTCTNPAPAFGGSKCTGGHKREDQFCNVPCTEPLDGGWSPWSGYSFCTVSCNGGFQIRSRTCSQPFPERGGRDCQGHRIEKRSCNTHPCPTTQPPVVTTPTSQPATTYHESRNHTESENHTESGNYTEMYTTAAPTTTELPPTTASQGGQIDVPYIDLVFAVSSTSNNSAQTYALMQNTIKRFIDLYGADKIHYSVIAFGDAVVRVVDFNHTFPPTANELKAAIDAQSPLAGGPVLVDALGETLRIFNETKTRPNARKVLVVMTDENSGADEETLATAVRPLEDDNILVISVATGAANRSELLIISPNPLDVISADDNQDSIGLARHIMDRILRKIPEIDVGFAITAASVTSRVIFNLKLQTIQAINERYQGHKVSFSVIVYGSRRTTRLTFDSSSTNHETLIADVNHIDEVSGPVDLKKALMEAEQLFRSLGRPSAKKVFVVLTDSGNDNEIIAAGDILRRHGVILLSVDHTGDQFNSVKITHIDYLGIPTVITDRPVVVAETIIYKALQVNIPEIDLTFAISATSVQSEDTVDLMRRTIQSIILQYGIDRIHYSVIYFGSVAATRFDFSNAPPDQDEMIRQVGRLPERDGLPSPDLVEPLNEAKRIYELQEVRPNARRVLVVIMDNSSVSNENKLKEAVNALVNNSVFIIGVGIGPNINRRDLILITRELPHVLVVTINKSPQELAEEIMEIIDLGIRTAGFSRWGWWSTCSKTCLSFGVPGTQSRTRVCERPRLGCQGATVETRECNTENCQGCQEREPPSDESYQASTAIQPARLARLNTSNPSASQLAWCRDTEDAGGFVQIDLGEQVLISRIATKGQEMLNAARWVMTFYVSLSPDGLTYSDYQEGGERKDFLGNDDPFNIIFHNLSSSGPIQYIRFHPITYQEQPCMQASVFGCPANIGPVVNRISDISGAGTGILLALWILAGILSFLLLMACCYYCCWHVCCGRGKKRKGLAASYLIEDDVDNRWILMPPFMASRLKPVAESEIQEVTVEIAEETPKVSGVISFGIEAEETKEKFVTAEGVHSETPVYSEDGVAVTSNASTLSMGSSATGSQTSERRKRIKSEAAASVSSAESSRQSSFKSDSLGGSGFYNKGYLGSVEWLNEPAPSPSQKRGSRKRDLTRSQSVDELATVDFGMFENHRGSTQAVEMGRDGYMRMQQTSGERVDVPVAPQANVASDKHQMYSTEEQVLTFMTEGGDPNNMRILEDWMTGRAGDRGNSNGPKEPLYSQVGAQIRSENDPTYAVVGSQIKAENGPTYSVVGSQIKAAENDPTYSEVGSQIKADDDPIYSEVGSQI